MELASIRDTVSQDDLGLMRLAWWESALKHLYKVLNEIWILVFHYDGFVEKIVERLDP